MTIFIKKIETIDKQNEQIKSLKECFGKRESLYLKNKYSEKNIYLNLHTLKKNEKTTYLLSRWKKIALSR